MQRKIIIDTGVYIDLFNRGLHKEVINPFQNVTYLAYPVLHELLAQKTLRRGSGSTL